MLSDASTLIARLHPDRYRLGQQAAAGKQQKYDERHPGIHVATASSY
ncbi:MAG: hypothetical protein ACOJUL_13840 [Candidatus Pollutiaquabacter aromativorans]